ncbi:hypothetical protein PHMEG_00035917 [Phytophthora megakarya]|uniref:Uncharacterized protein n=1 Tax=Phytophthora megakarya TaxID=4795 RepID=A0A225UMZ2_9STRA|nr:hypothetical protein PHMEG_00035917 [Phytophthora megakarya]
MEFVFTKNFYGLNVLELMQRTWVNSLQLDEFKKIKAETRRLQVLQQINQTAMVFVCDVGPCLRVSWSNRIESITPGTLSDGLTGTGYVLGTQSVSTDYPLQLSERKSCENVTWAHLALSIEALEVFNSTTGENYQRIRWVGRTDYGSKEHAQRDAADTLQSMLRWEMLLVAPALNLP